MEPSDSIQSVLWHRYNSQDITCPTISQSYVCRVMGSSLQWELITPLNRTTIRAFTSIDDTKLLPYTVDQYYTFSDLEWDGEILSVRLTIHPSPDLNMTTIKCTSLNYSDNWIHAFGGNLYMYKCKGIVFI